MTRPGEEKIIGIDISKSKLDAFWLSTEQQKQFCHAKTGVRSRVARAKDAVVARVVYGLTGIYHRSVGTGFADHNISFAQVNNSCEVRRFCERAGQLVKQTR